jgi:hypothetical protein
MSDIPSRDLRPRFAAANPQLHSAKRYFRVDAATAQITRTQCIFFRLLASFAILLFVISNFLSLMTNLELLQMLPERIALSLNQAVDFAESSPGQ